MLFKYIYAYLYLRNFIPKLIKNYFYTKFLTISAIGIEGEGARVLK